MGDAAGQLPDRLQRLRLAQRLLGVGEGSLLAGPFGHVVDELVGTCLVAIGVPERSVKLDSEVA